MIKKILLIFCIIVVLILTVILVPGFYIKNWKTFVSSENNYSIQYPGHWQVDKTTNFLSLSSYHGNQGSYPLKGEVWISVWVQELKTKSFDVLVQEVAEATEKDKKEFTKIKNADKAYTVGSYLYVLKGNKFYSIILDQNQPTLRNRIDSVLIIGSFKLK